MEYYGGDSLKSLSEERWANAALPQLKDRQKPLKRLFGVADAILEISPDVLMLVEVGGAASLENFNHHFLNDRYEIHFLPGNAKRGIDLGFLVLKGLGYTAASFSNRDFPIEVMAWQGKQISHFSRDVAELRLSSSDGSLAYLFLLTHLKSQLSTDGDVRGKDVRTAEAFALAELYRRRRQEFPRASIIVGGDLNAELDSLDLEALRQTDLEDFQDIVGTRQGDRATLVHFDYSGSPNPLVFDYLLLSPPAANQIVPQESFVHRYRNYYGDPEPLPQTRSERWRMPSDHYPLVVTLQEKRPD